MMKKTPGPRAPPDKSRPRRKITARSYSWEKNIDVTYLYPKTYLNNFDDEEQGQGQGGDDHEEGGHSEKVSTNARPFFAHLPLLLLPWRRPVVPVHCRNCTGVAGFLLGTNVEKWCLGIPAAGS